MLNSGVRCSFPRSSGAAYFGHFVCSFGSSNACSSSARKSPQLVISVVFSSAFCAFYLNERYDSRTNERNLARNFFGTVIKLSPEERLFLDDWFASYCLSFLSYVCSVSIFFYLFSRLPCACEFYFKSNQRLRFFHSFSRKSNLKGVYRYSYTFHATCKTLHLPICQSHLLQLVEILLFYCTIWYEFVFVVVLF